MQRLLADTLSLYGRADWETGHDVYELTVIRPCVCDGKVHVAVVVHKVLTSLLGPSLGVLVNIGVTLTKEALRT